jgi:hypothetical protein
MLNLLSAIILAALFSSRSIKLLGFSDKILIRLELDGQKTTDTRIKMIAMAATINVFRLGIVANSAVSI